MRNPRITKKERNLLKGAIRRVFSRSELRKQALDKALVKDYHDPSRKRVTRWGNCAGCGELTPLYKLQIDHMDPVIPVDSSLDEMNWDQVIDRVWCDERLLQAICTSCHEQKSKLEGRERKANKAGKK